LAANFRIQHDMKESLKVGS